MSENAPPVIDYAPADLRDRRSLRLPTWLCLSAILALAAGLRCYHLSRHSLWLDEFLSVQNSTGRGQLHMKLPVDRLIDPAPELTHFAHAPGVAAIWTSLDRETHPPLYYILLGLWRHVFGESDLAGRWFSIAAALVGIILFYQSDRLLHGRAPALWGCVIMALAGAQIYAAQEVRSYTLSITLMLAATLAIIRIEKLGPSRLRFIGLGLSVLAMLLTHYLSFGPAAAIGLYAIIRLRGPSRRGALTALAAALVIWAIAWGPLFLQQARRFHREHAWMEDTDPAGSPLLLTLGRLSVLPFRYFTELSGDATWTNWIARLSSVLYLLPVLLLRRRPDLLIWLLILLAAILQVAAADIVRSAWALEMIRYTLLASVPTYALAAALLAHEASGWLRHAVPLVLCVSCAAAMEAAYQRWQGEWNEPAEYLARTALPGDVVLFHKTDPADWSAHALYLGISHYAVPPGPLAIVTGPPTDPALLRRLGTARSIWLIEHSSSAHNETILPGSRLLRSRYFPYLCTVSELRWQPAAAPATSPATGATASSPRGDP